MDNRDFLKGIDEDFQQLMNHRGNGKGNGQASSHRPPPAESVTARIIARLGALTHEQRVEVLEFIDSLRRNGPA